METLPITTLSKIFDYAFDQKKTGKAPEGYREFFEIVAGDPRSVDYKTVIRKLYGDQAVQDKEIRIKKISNLQKQRQTINKTIEAVYGKETVYINIKHRKEWQLVITKDFRKELEGVPDTELNTVLENWHKTKGKLEKVKDQPKKKRRLTIEDQLRRVPDSELIQRFYLQRHRIITRIHEAYALELDPTTSKTLDSLNVQRRSQKYIPYHPGRCYRLISAPTVNDSEVILNLAPINYACFVMVNDRDVPRAVKKYTQDRINDMASRMPQSFQTSHPILNAYNHVPLGTQIVIITRDRKTLLRKRGKSVAFSPKKWSMAFGGHCSENDVGDAGLDLGLTAENELRREIGTLTLDTRDIIFTGLHCNTRTGSNCVLGFWQLEAGVDELASLLTDKYPGEMKVFKTTKRTEEGFVFDCKNIIADFTARDILKALTKARSSISKLIPECFAALILALNAYGLSSSELFQ
jgi:hypothetical protein